MSIKESIEERFLYFHQRNPEVYAHLLRLALQAKRKGRDRIGIKMLWEVLRWNVWLDTGSTPKLCNDFHAYYARLLMQQEPELAGMFELRELRGPTRKTADDEEDQDLASYYADFFN